MIFAGIDGGATTTRAVLISETGVILGLGISGPSNYDNVGVQTAYENIGGALAQAWRSAGVSPVVTDAAFFGMAGVVSEADREIIQDIAVQHNVASVPHIGIDHDIRIALAGGLGGKEGIVLITGTGSSCYGRRNDGSNHRTGWGYLLDDLGSGYFLGLQAMIATIQEADGRGKPTTLSASVQQRFGYKHIDDIMGILYHEHVPVTNIASLAPLVLAAAQSGDKVALNIVRRGAEELSRMVEAVACKLGLGQSCAITFAGGLIQSSFYMQHIETAIKLRLPESLLRRPELPPVLGAAILALELAHVPITQQVLTNLKLEERKLETILPC
ncbi:MAG: BadF/BadG/BcrA/BcrD ATPase family protein [bacterium]